MTQPPLTPEPWVRQELVIAPMMAEDATDAIAQLGDRLVFGQFVKLTWIEATLQREKVFPTGLPTAEIQVAIPHTDIEHVLRQAVAVGVLEKPIAFKEMGNPDGEVMAQIVCALAVTQSDQLVELLQRLVTMFQKPEVLRQIVASRDPVQIAEIFNRNLQNGVQ